MRKFDRSLPMALLKAREAVMKKFMPSLKEHKLSSQQWRVIRALEDEDGLEISELSVRCHLLMPSLSRIIQNLESRTLVKRQAHQIHQRNSILFLTQSGMHFDEFISP